VSSPTFFARLAMPFAASTCYVASVLRPARSATFQQVLCATSTNTRHFSRFSTPKGIRFIFTFVLFCKLDNVYIILDHRLESRSFFGYSSRLLFMSACSSRRGISTKTNVYESYYFRLSGFTHDIVYHFVCRHVCTIGLLQN